MLKITMEFKEDILFIQLKGKLLQKEVAKCEKNIICKIRNEKIRNVVFNIDGLTEIDLKGIYLFLYVYELIRENKGNTLLCETKDSIVFEKLRKRGIFRYIKLVSKELDAVGKIKIWERI